MPSGEFKKLGYPAPIVDHKASRERALFRYKNAGERKMMRCSHMTDRGGRGRLTWGG